MSDWTKLRIYTQGTHMISPGSCTVGKHSKLLISGSSWAACGSTSWQVLAAGAVLVLAQGLKQGPRRQQGLWLCQVSQ